MSKPMGLGKGLGSLIPHKIPNSIISDRNKEFLITDAQNKIMHVSVDDIEVNPHQPRTVFNHEDLEELIESIKIYGIIQPLIVTKQKGGYQLIAGERRLRSAKIIGLETVPVIMREADEQEKLEIALIENVQRKNLNPMEKAVAYQRLMDEFNLSQEEVSEKMGVSRSSVANSLRFLFLPEEIQTALSLNEISEGHAKVIAGLDNAIDQLAFLKKIKSLDYSVRDAEKESRQILGRGPKKKRQTKDPFTAEKEERLREKLNTRVQIEQKGEKGQIVIEFYSEEELDSIVDQIIL